MTAPDRYNDGFDVGDFLRYSWGVTDTIVQFFLITRRSPHSVWIEEVEVVNKQSHPGAMCGAAMIKEPVVRRPGDHNGVRRLQRVLGSPLYVRMKHGRAVPTRLGEKHRVTWYN